MPGHQPPAPARFVSGRRTAWLVALVPILLALAVIALVPEGERDNSAVDTLPAGADSTFAVELAEQLPEDDGQVAIVLWTTASGEIDQAVQQDLTAQAIELLSAASGTEGGAEGQPGGEAGQGGQPGGGQAGPVVVSEDRTAAFAAIPVTSTSATDNIDKVEDLREQLRDDAPDGLDVQVTGPAGIQADLGKVFDGANFRLLLSTAGVVALLLIITYRSPVLWLVPLIVVGIADRLSAIVATNVLQVTGVAWDESTIGILSVLVFGAGTDYALLLISRYRDELKKEESRHVAMARAVSRTAEAVASSSITVVLGLLTLLLSAIPTTRGLGPRVRGRRGDRRDVRARRAPRRARALRALGVLAQGPPRRRHRPGRLRLLALAPRRRRRGPPAAHVRRRHRPRPGRARQRHAGHQHRARPGRPVPPEARGDLGRRAPRRVLPGRHERPRPGGHPRRPEQVLQAVEGVDGVDSARITTSGDGIARIDAVPDADPGSDAATGDRGRRPRRQSPTSATPTSAVVTPSRSTPRTTPPATGCSSCR